MPRPFTLLLPLALLASAAPTRAHDGPSAAEGVAQMAAAADRFLDVLNDGAKAKAHVALDDAGRTKWAFVPDSSLGGPRQGLPVGAMTTRQRLYAHALLASALSSEGYVRSLNVMALEAVLHDLEGQNPIRDPDLYYFTVFGTPAADGAWGWRCEGHHLSLNFTVADGKLVSATPSFFGSNPGEVRSGALAGAKVLAEAESLGRRLLDSLDDGQLAQAVIADEAPREVLAAGGAAVERGTFGPPAGIAAGNLRPEQRKMLAELVDWFVRAHRPHLIAPLARRTGLTDLDDARFAWAGATVVGGKHYYRVQTPRFVFEYDNTQGEGNHVHTVWRDFDGDFGADLLEEHLKREHAAGR